MVSQVIWIGIIVGVFFAGIGISYAVFSSTYNPSSMKFANQELFDQMMSHNPKMAARWMDATEDPQQMQQLMQDPQFQQQMFDHMNTMMNNPDFRNQMYGQMFQHHEFMNEMMANPEFQQQWMGPMMDQGMLGSMMQGRMMGPGMMHGSQSFTPAQSLPADEESQTRTFEISMEEVEFMAEVVTENGEEAFATVELHTWEPNLIIVNQGDTVVLNISNPRKHAHTFSIPDFAVNSKILEPREGFDSVTFVADKAGVFTFYCGLPYNPDRLYCDPDHSMMTGTLIVLE